MGPGGQVALGNDYATFPTNGIGVFEMGMPLHELTLMRDAGMTPMEVIVAATRTAALACGLEREIGTLEPGKAADVLLIDGDPLMDLSALKRVRAVVHEGVLVREPPR